MLFIEVNFGILTLGLVFLAEQASEFLAVASILNTSSGGYQLFCLLVCMAVT